MLEGNGDGEFTAPGSRIRPDSVKGLVLQLHSEGYFNEERSTSEVGQELSNCWGRKVKTNHVATALQQLTGDVLLVVRPTTAKCSIGVPPMLSDDAVGLLDRLCQQSDQVLGLAKTAKRNRKPLSGNNYYGHKFHDVVVAISAVEARLSPLMKGLELATLLDDFHQTLAFLKSPQIDERRRSEAVKALKLQVHSVIKPRLEAIKTNPVPETEQVLPHSVVEGAGTYYETLIRQANGCYERGWYDACLVMVRRFVESLIIEVYEAHRMAAEIKDNQGEFLLLYALVGKVVNETQEWNLGRESKKVLP